MLTYMKKSAFFPDVMFDTVYDIPIDYLKENNISGLIFDLDNTLAAYTDVLPPDTVVELLTNLRELGFKVAVVSNNGTRRVMEFCRELNIPAFALARKPLIKTLKKAAQAINLHNDNVAMIGDQIFTDVYAGNRAKMHTILVNAILPVNSWFFKLKVYGERRVLRKFDKYINLKAGVKNNDK